MRSNLQRIATLIFLAVLVGCTTPKHTNTLIFGTNTKLALDISQSPTNLASITFGYKREEAVWMPLLANTGNNSSPCNPNDDEKPTDTTKNSTEEKSPKNGESSSSSNKNTSDNSTNGANCLFQGTDGTDSKDTYSVLASFGAKFNGEAKALDSGQAKAGGGLSQFFATGIAARELAKNKSVSKLFSLQPNPELSKSQIEKIQKGYEIEKLQTKKIINIAFDDGKSKNLTQNFSNLVNNSDIDPSTKQEILRAKDADDLRDVLEISDFAITPLYESIMESEKKDVKPQS